MELFKLKYIHGKKKKKIKGCQNSRIHFQGGTCQIFCLSSEKESTLKEKNLLPREKFFSFRVDPFSEGDWCAEKANKKSKKLFPLWEMMEKLPGVKYGT